MQSAFSKELTSKGHSTNLSPWMRIGDLGSDPLGPPACPNCKNQQVTVFQSRRLRRPWGWICNKCGFQFPFGQCQECGGALSFSPLPVPKGIVCRDCSSQQLFEVLSAAQDGPLGGKKAPGGKRPQLAGRGKLAYRAAHKRFILVELINDPSARNLKICRAADADGQELFKAWRADGNRLWEHAYKSPKIRPKMQICISKIRADMRKAGLL